MRIWVVLACAGLLGAGCAAPASYALTVTRGGRTLLDRGDEKAVAPGLAEIDATGANRPIVVTVSATGFAVRAGQGGSNPDDEGRGIVLDPAGNSYIVGTQMYADGVADTTGSGFAECLVDIVAAQSLGQVRGQVQQRHGGCQSAVKEG